MIAFSTSVITHTQAQKKKKKHTNFNSKHSDMLEKLPIIHEFTPTHNCEKTYAQVERGMSVQKL